MIGNRLKDYRISKGLDIKGMAKLIDISQGNLSDLENNKSKPATKTINKIIRNTDINLSWLMYGEGEMIKDKLQTYTVPVQNNSEDEITKNKLQAYTVPPKQQPIPRGTQQPEFTQNEVTEKDLEAVEKMMEAGKVKKEIYKEMLLDFIRQKEKKQD